METEYYKELDSIEKRHHKVNLPWLFVCLFVLSLNYKKNSLILVMKFGREQTGSGFIQVGKEGGGNVVHTQFIDAATGGRVHLHGGYKGNPATNDWLPTFDDRDLIFKSQKPNRSEGC